MIECAWVQSAASITKSEPLIPKIVSMFTAVSNKPTQSMITRQNIIILCIVHSTRNATVKIAVYCQTKYW